MREKEAFSYFVSEKSQLMVISFMGLIDGDGTNAMREIEALLGQASAKLIVLNLRGLQGIAPSTIPWLASLQSQIRKRKADLRVCGIPPELKEILSRNGILRASELVRDLESALVAWVQMQRP